MISCQNETTAPTMTKRTHARPSQTDQKAEKKEMPIAFAPPDARSMTSLDRSRFAIDVVVPALRIPAKAAAAAMQSLRGSGLLVVPRIRSVVEDPLSEPDSETPTRLLLLDPSVNSESMDTLPEKVKEFAKQHNAGLAQHTLHLTYDYWSAEQIIRSFLPESMEAHGAFETIGHIAHLNLRDLYNPYKKMIGQVILDKCKNIKTVVNKTDKIDHTFRFFQMELLAGEDVMIAELKEGGCTFKFDFSKVYWNSRLQSEHSRITNLFKPGDLICDVFAGVGPFALPAAKRNGCIVFANDLNPVSHKYLVENIKLNKLDGRVRPYNMDGRDFICQSLQDLNDDSVWSTVQSSITKQKPKSKPSQKKQEPSQADHDAKQSTPTATDTIVDRVAEHSASKPRLFQHYIMNLPATAIEFLDAFRGLLSGQRGLVSEDRLPMIHCHCFSRSDDQINDVIQRTQRVLGAPLGQYLVQVYNVRNVAPKKDMMCISFRVPPNVVFGEEGNHDENANDSGEAVQGGESVLGKRKSNDNEENE